MIIKKNKLFILSLLIMVMIVGLSFKQFYDEHFSYIEGYNIIKENCYQKHDLDHEYCKRFKTDEQLEYYIKLLDPKDKYKSFDAITVTCTIVEFTVFQVLQYLSPLIIIIAVIGIVHSEFSTGMFKNYLLRMSYKDYLKKMYKKTIKAALIMPIGLILVFLTASVFTKFNYNVSPESMNWAGYEEWKYSNFFLYGCIILLIQFLISLLYVNIALFSCKKNQNKLVAIIMGYVLFIIVNLFIYAILYSVIINKIFHFRNLTDYFNIAGYWFFNSGPKFLYVIPIAFSLFVISTIILYYFYSKKEKVIQESERQVA